MNITGNGVFSLTEALKEVTTLQDIALGFPELSFSLIKSFNFVNRCEGIKEIPASSFQQLLSLKKVHFDFQQ